MDQYINRTLWITFYPLLAVGSLYAVFILCLTRPAIQKL